jgi:polyisoprenoid-binding protein YceI
MRRSLNDLAQLLRDFCRVGVLTHQILTESVVGEYTHPTGKTSPAAVWLGHRFTCFMEGFFMKFPTRFALLSTLALGLMAGSALAADTYKIDPVHATAIFRISHLGSSFVYGRFDDVEGTFAVDDQTPANVNFDVTIKTDSVDTNSAARDKHLKSADFFSANEFPALTFKSTEVKSDGDKKYDVTGDLTIHGVTKSVTAKVEFVGTADASQMKMGFRAGYEAHLTIKRSDFGMDKLVGPVGDEVQLIISMEGVKQ